MTEAARFNAGKSRVDLIEASFIEATGMVLGFGAEKYGEDNWKGSLNTPKHDAFVKGCYASILRHTLKIGDGTPLDEESGLPHTAHVACNAMFIQYYQENKND